MQHSRPRGARASGLWKIAKPAEHEALGGQCLAQRAAGEALAAGATRRSATMRRLSSGGHSTIGGGAGSSGSASRRAALPAVGALTGRAGGGSAFGTYSKLVDLRRCAAGSSAARPNGCGGLRTGHATSSVGLSGARRSGPCGLRIGTRRACRTRAARAAAAGSRARIVGSERLGSMRAHRGVRRGSLRVGPLRGAPRWPGAGGAAPTTQARQ